MTTTTKFKSNVHITGNLRVDGTTTIAGNVRSPYDHEGVGNGVVDDTSAIQAAIDYLYTNHGGGEVDLSGGRWLVDSGNIQMKTGVTLVGPWNQNGLIDTPDDAITDWSRFKGTIVLNPTYTILMQTYDSCGLRGLLIVRKGLTVPSSVRTAIDIVNAFSGTAVTVGTGGVDGWGNQAYVGYCLILGFQYAINLQRASRSVFEYVFADCTNGISINQSYDMQHMTRCHIFPFVTSAFAPATYAVSATASNGGLIRLTIASHVLVTGDIVTVYGVGGTTAADGRWTVTVINSTTIDLQGSTYAGAYTSGGTVYLNTIARHGTAYHFDGDIDWGQASDCFNYGYDIGFHIFDSEHCELINCGSDSYAPAHDATSIGFLVEDSVSTKLIGCRAVGGICAKVDTGAGASVAIIGGDFWGTTSSTGVYVLTGHANINNSQFYSLSVGILVDATSDGITAIGNTATGTVTTPLTIPAGAALRKSRLWGNDWIDAAGIGNRMLTQSSERGHYFADYSTLAAGFRLIGQKARTSAASPTAAASADVALYLRGDFWDGVSAFQTGGLYRIEATATTSATSSPAKHVWGVTPSGSVTVADEMSLDDTNLSPTADLGLTLGTTSLRWSIVYSRFLSVMDPPATIPGTVAGQAFIYVDPADGDLKVKFGDGTIKTIVVDT